MTNTKRDALAEEVYNSGGHKSCFLEGYDARDEEVSNLKLALQKISSMNKPIGTEGHRGPEDPNYWYKQELMSRDIADKALREHESGVAGG